MSGAPLKVLFVHYGDEWIRGSETLLLDLLRGLDRDRITPIVWCNGAEMAEASRDAGYPTTHTAFDHFLDYSSPRPSLSRYRGLVREARQLCRTHGIRVMHANSGAPVQWLVPAGLSERLPVLAHLHIDYLRRSRYVLLLHAASLAVGVSRQVIDSLIGDGMAPERTRVIYNGIDFGRLTESGVDLRAKLGIPPDAFVVTTAGSLIVRKGHDVLIRAFAALEAGAIPAHLLIPSGGEERAALEALAVALGVADRVHFLGYIDDLVQVFRAADIFALASRGDAFGLVLAEAGHFGLPCVSTRVGGIPEVIADGKTGLLVAPDDVAAFATALARLRHDVALRTWLGAGAISRVEAMFTARQMALQFEDTYAELARMPAAELGWGRMLHKTKPYTRLITAAGRKQAPRYAG